MRGRRETHPRYGGNCGFLGKYPEIAASLESRVRSNPPRPGGTPPLSRTGSNALTSWLMTDEKQERADRDQERSEEAHWQVAEAGAEAEEGLTEAARKSDSQQDDWENEGGALDREQKQPTEEG
jgi:hypothetical protein